MSESDSEGPCATARKQQPGLTPPLGASAQSSHYIAGTAAHTTKGSGTIESPEPQPLAEAHASENLEESGCDGVEVTLDQTRITARIKGLYKELLQAPIPDEWVRLVKALETKERK